MTLDEKQVALVRDYRAMLAELLELSGQPLDTEGCAVCGHRVEQHRFGGECAESYHCGCMRFREPDLADSTCLLYAGLGRVPHQYTRGLTAEQIGAVMDKHFGGPTA